MRDVTNVVDLPALARQLASRAGGAEANIQAHIQTLLLYGGLNLGEDDLITVELEAQAGGGRPATTVIPSARSSAASDAYQF